MGYNLYNLAVEFCRQIYESDDFIGDKDTQLAIIDEAIVRRIKRNPKPIDNSPFPPGWKYRCPECYGFVGENENDTDGYSMNEDFCPQCGQALNWDFNY